MIKFYGLLDFFPNRIEIKKEFDKLTISEKRIYKKEVYSICFEREYIKDLIWEYLNDWEYSLPDLAKEWRIKSNKQKQRMIRMENNNDSNKNYDDNNNNIFDITK